MEVFVSLVLSVAERRLVEQRPFFSPPGDVKGAQEKATQRLGSGMALDMGEADMKNILGYLN